MTTLEPVQELSLDPNTTEAMSFVLFLGVLADTLTRGRHVLGVLPVPPPPTASSAKSPDVRKPTEIPFWR